MSRVLNKKIILCLIVVLGSVILGLMGYIVGMLAFPCLCFCLYIINRNIRKQIAKSNSAFNSMSPIRNIDRLIIGDMMKLPNELKVGSFLQIEAPNRSLLSSYEILRHTHSILKDDGEAEVILVVKRSNMSKGKYTIFDIPFFHYITIRQKKLEKLQRNMYYPLLYDPLNSLCYWLKIRTKGYTEVDNTIDDNISKFCTERNFKVRFWVK